MTKRDRELLSAVAKILAAAERARKPWVGTRESGVMPNTGDALLTRGWVDRRTERPGGRLTYRVTDAGRSALACPACTGTGYETTDPEDASTCLDCNGTGRRLDNP